MDLKNHIKENLILTGVEAVDKWDLIQKLTAHLYKNLPKHFTETLSQEIFSEEVTEREKKQSTAMGYGFALPHARIEGFKSLGVCLATLKEPMEFNALDGKPVSIVCLVITPVENPEIVLKTWSSISRLLSDEAVREYLMNAESPKVIYDYLQRKELNLNVSILAKDIMLKPKFHIKPNTPIAEVTFKMHSYKEPAIAVVDDAENMLGEITSDALFQYGMPEFFSKLKSVSFVRHFNPLEKYYKDEANTCAGDIMSKQFAAVPPDATIIEVIFELSVKKHTKVYVVDEGKLIGIIGRISVIDRAINF